MSLVVAESTDDGPRIVSDTRVTLPETEAGRPSFRRDTLKAIVLSREAVVCFAGDVDRGLRSVREAAVALASGEPPDSLVHILFESIQDTSKEVEFVVALLNNPGNWPESMRTGQSWSCTPRGSVINWPSRPSSIVATNPTIRSEPRS